MSLINGLKWRFRREKNRCIIWRTKKNIYANDFTIISQNCIGGVLYHDLGMEFQSPTINTFIKEPDFVRMVLNLRYYMSLPIVMRWDEEYPVGTLDDIEIHFMHYETCKEAKEAWERRVKRINWEKIIILATDRNGFNDTVFEEWKHIPYPKILYTVKSQYAAEQGSVLYPQYLKNGYVPDLIPKREFYKDDVLVDMVNNLGRNINGTTSTN